MKNIIYEKPFLRAMRIFACAATALLLIVTSIRIYNTFVTKQIDLTLRNISVISENTIAIVLFYLIIIQPQKIEYLAIASFMYSFFCMAFELNNPMGILMYGLGISVFYVRGLFINKTKLKAIIALIVYICLFFSGLIFGFVILKIPGDGPDYYEAALEKFGYSLVLSIILFLLITHNRFSKEDSQTTPKTLNLAEYPGLTQTDVVLLQKVLENEQYKNIAREVFKAPGTIRNRLNKIYDILGVMDRMGFISTFMGYEIVFEETK